MLLRDEDADPARSRRDSAQDFGTVDADAVDVGQRVSEAEESHELPRVG
jgi:hypothetical protein